MHKLAALNATDGIIFSWQPCSSYVVTSVCCQLVFEMVVWSASGRASSRLRLQLQLRLKLHPRLDHNWHQLHLPLATAAITKVLHTRYQMSLIHYNNTQRWLICLIFKSRTLIGQFRCITRPPPPFKCRKTSIIDHSPFFNLIQFVM